MTPSETDTSGLLTVDQIMIHPLIFSSHLPIPDIVNGEASYDLEEILESAFSKRAGLRYFVLWSGCRPEDNSRIQASETHAGDSLVLAFHTEHPSKPGYGRAFPPAPLTPTSSLRASTFGSFSYKHRIMPRKRMRAE